MRNKRIFVAVIAALYASSAYHFVRYYVFFTEFYLKLNAYLTGRERIPFQERILPVFIMRPLLAWQPLTHLLSSRRGALSPPARGIFFLISLVTFAVVIYYTHRLYYAVSTRKTFAYLVYPFLLYTVMWSYSIHIDQNFSYPYDFLSLAFFTAGLYYIYKRQFLPLVFIMLIGTLNRETTLFLIGIYILDAATIPTVASTASFRERFDRAQIDWFRVAILCIIWASIKLTLSHYFAHNDNSENHIRLAENLVIFNPKNWPGALNICGYLLPVAFILRRRIEPIRFANYFYILAPWIAIMAISGLLIETRIYGELSTYVAIAAVLELEHYADHLRDIRTTPGSTDEPTSSHPTEAPALHAVAGD